VYFDKLSNRLSNHRDRASVGELVEPTSRLCVGELGKWLMRRRGLVEVKPHADSFAVLVVQLGVEDKTGFLIERQDAFIMFDVGVYCDKTGGEIRVVTSAGNTVGGLHHKRTNAPVFLLKGTGDGQCGNFVSDAIFIAGMVLKG
jgi:hypothetical protein